MEHHRKHHNKIGCLHIYIQGWLQVGGNGWGMNIFKKTALNLCIFVILMIPQDVKCDAGSNDVTYSVITLWEI